MNNTFYRKIVQKLNTAYAYHRIICTEDGIPCDYEIIEVNAEFERLTGLKGADIAGKPISEVLPGIKTDKFDWISIYGDVALNKSDREFEQYSEPLKKHFKVKVFSPQKFYFITLFDEVSINKQSMDATIAEQEYFEMILDFDSNVVLTIRMSDEMIINANRHFTESLGYSHYEVVGKNCLEVGICKKPMQNQEVMVELRNYGSFSSREITFRRKDGSDFVGLMSGKKVFVSDDSYVFNSIRSISDHKQLEDELAEANEALNMSERKFESYIQHAPSGVITFDDNGNYMEANSAASEITGYSIAQLLKMNFRDIAVEESLANVYTLFETLKEKGRMSGELQFRHKSGLTRWLNVDAVKLSEQRFLGFANDITDKKKAEETLMFMGYHDQLTGLYNRRYFETTIGRMDTDDNLPISIVMCDINGLKVANDSFGHDVGDALLVHTANIFRELAQPGEIAARFGGDEFILVYPKTTSSAVKRRIEEIKLKAAGTEVSGLHLSLSFGYETKVSSKQTFMETLSNAENHMYRNKLFEESSLRSKTIDVIMQTLFEKSDRESMHSKRVSAICKAIASAMGFDGEEVDRIRIAGLVHDIGKIAISESILNKSSNLSDPEWIEMKKHSEIGWRILSTAKEFFNLANYVLSHHERWDGLGYPNGIKQEDIPIEARIIALADSYDAMTSKRSYRNEMSKDQAIEEIKRCAGTQFDPKVVDIFVNKVIPTRTAKHRI